MGLDFSALSVLLSQSENAVAQGHYGKHEPEDELLAVVRAIPLPPKRSLRVGWRKPPAFLTSDEELRNWDKACNEVAMLTGDPVFPMGSAGASSPIPLDKNSVFPRIVPLEVVHSKGGPAWGTGGSR